MPGMAFGDAERRAESTQDHTRRRILTIDESNLKAPTLTTTPLLMALSAFALLLVGVILGAAGVRLVSGPRVHATLDVPSSVPPRRTRSRPPMPEVVTPLRPMPEVITPPTPPPRPSSHRLAKKRSHNRPLGQQPNVESLESIMYHYRTDMSKDDKKYSDLFAMLFDPVRMKVRNITQVGMGDGGSMMTWHDYFRKASIYGVDESLSRVKDYLAGLPRLHLLKANAMEAKVSALGLRPGSMDIVFESAGQGLKGQEQILPRLWPLVRTGGYYVIEDVSWDRDLDDRAYPLLHNQDQLPTEVRKIMSENDAFFADTTLGHRAFDDFIREVPEDLNRFSHNAHVIVIRKRSEPLRTVSVNTRGNLPVIKHATRPTPEPAEKRYARRQRRLLGYSN